MKFIPQFSSILLSSLLVLKPLWAQSPAPVSGTELQIHVADSAGIFARGQSQAPRGFAIQVTDASGAGAADAAVVVRLPDEGATGVFSDGTHAAIAYTDGAGIAHIGPISWNTVAGGALVKITATKGTAHAGTLLDESMISVPANVTPASVPPTATAATRVEQPVVPPQQPGTTVSTGHALLPSPVVAPTPNEPTVSVINRRVRDRNDRVDTGGSHKKWIILAVVIAAGAGAGIALAGKGNSSPSSSSSSTSGSTGVSIGSPTVSVGIPH